MTSDPETTHCTHCGGSGDDPRMSSSYTPRLCPKCCVPVHKSTAIPAVPCRACGAVHPATAMCHTVLKPTPQHTGVAAFLAAIMEDAVGRPLTADERARAHQRAHDCLASIAVLMGSANVGAMK